MIHTFLSKWRTIVMIIYNIAQDCVIANELANHRVIWFGIRKTLRAGIKTIKIRRMKNYIKLGFDSEETKEIAESLNTLMANYHVHYQKLRNYHWNVEGNSFFDLHDFFELEYNAVKFHIDEIAERIRVFGKKPVSTLKEYLEMAEIKETDTSLTSEEMVKEILNDFETLISLCIDAHEKTATAGDLATSDLLIGYIKRTEKSHWMLSSFIK